MSEFVLSLGTLINLNHCDIGQGLPHIGHRFVVPEIVAEEYCPVYVANLKQHGLVVRPISSTVVHRVEQLSSLQTRIGIPDLYALAYASVSGSLLLASDKSLRQIASVQNVQSRDVIWLLQKMVSRRIVPATMAAAALEEMFHSGTYTPSEECVSLIGQWRGAASMATAG